MTLFGCFLSSAYIFWFSWCWCHYTICTWWEMKCVTCHMSHVTCHMSCVTCHSYYYFYSIFFLFFQTICWSLSVEGLLSTGPTCLVSSSFEYIFQLWAKLCHQKRKEMLCFPLWVNTEKQGRGSDLVGNALIQSKLSLPKLSNFPPKNKSRALKKDKMHPYLLFSAALSTMSWTGGWLIVLYLLLTLLHSTLTMLYSTVYIS